VAQISRLSQLVNIDSLSMNALLTRSSFIQEEWADGPEIFLDFWRHAVVNGKNWKDPNDWHEGDIVMPQPGYFGGGDWLVGK
jgi:hypothetical protein